MSFKVGEKCKCKTTRTPKEHQENTCRFCNRPYKVSKIKQQPVEI